MALALAACGSVTITLPGSSTGTKDTPTTDTSTTGPDTSSPGSVPPTPLTIPTSLPTPSPLSWSPCTSLAAFAVTSVGRYQCATLRVPISYSDPGAGDLSIAVVMLPASGGGNVLGDIVTNPGGPGGSGVDFLEQNASGFPASLRSHFNLVSFDPRGVDRSDPVACVSPNRIRQLLGIDPAPTTQSQIDTEVSATKSFDEQCAAHTSHLLLENMSTVDAAIDMDQLRAALGQAKLTYIGFSYGTYLGAVYAELFPTHVRALVLDGAINPDLSNSEIDLEQAEGFEVDLHDFFAWCDTNSKCESELPGGAASDYQRLISAFENGRTLSVPLLAGYGGNRPLDYGVAVTGVLASLYSTQEWPPLAQALQQAIAGNGTDLEETALSYQGFQPNGSLENIQEANTAVNCLDHPTPTSVSDFVQLGKQFAAKAPDFGALEAWGSLACAFWPIPPTGEPEPIHAAGAPPILVVGSTRDPATPYEWAEALASQLDHGVLLTRDGDGHTAYFSSSCIRTWVDNYLTTLATPPKGTVCQSN